MKRSTFGYSYLATFFVIVLGSVLLFCVRSSKLQSWKWLIFGDLILVALPSMLVGVALVFLVDYLQLRQARKRLNAIQNRSIYHPKYGRPTDEVAVMPDIQVSDTASSANSILLESIVIKNFRNIQELRLNFRRPSTLLGEWTCIAGINGAGKTTILQAICLVLLGEESVNEFGNGRLGRMLRRSSSGTADAEIEAVVLYGGERTQLYLPLKREGSGEAAVDMDALRSNSKHSEMLKAWASLRKQVLVGYGASRNVSDVRDSRNSHLSRIAQRQMTLFDPLTQLASVNIILEGTKDVRPVIETLHQLISIVLQAEDLKPQSSSLGDKLRFEMHDTSLDVIDLPDGFRSTVAWLADLCSAWHECGGTSVSTDPQDITGIVLLDEISLHLHPSLERALVPQLRRALPKVQFIVSTHSPLVLSGFDRNELVILDSTRPGGTRQLDRQVFGMSMDDVYSWLMETSPASPVMEEMLKGDSSEVAEFLYQSKDVNEELAKRIVEERRKDIKQWTEMRDKA